MDGIGEFVKVFGGGVGGLGLALVAGLWLKGWIVLRKDAEILIANEARAHALMVENLIQQLIESKRDEVFWRNMVLASQDKIENVTTMAQQLVNTTDNAVAAMRVPTKTERTHDA